MKTPKLATNTRDAESGLQPLPPSQGIFYLIRFPEGWEPVISRFSEGQEMGHPVFWRMQVVPHLTLRWAPILKRNHIDVETDLRPCEYGFPRGRVVSKGKGRFSVVHGNEFMPFMKITPAHIETLFGIAGMAKWLEDDHEHCLREDKDPVRQILRLKENWKALESHRYNAS
jgi:hypothetical protein